MEYINLGRSDLRVSNICLGSMTWGMQNSQAEADRQLDYAVAKGINFVDTAEMYAIPPTAETYGTTETIIGNWFARNPGKRKTIVLASKIAGNGLQWIRGGADITGAAVVSAVDASLKRLQTDYIDLYQLHWPERNVPIFGQYRFEPSHERDCTPILTQLETLDELVQEGKIRYVGLSNETPWGVCQFLRLAEERGLPRVISIQNAYSLLNRVYESGLAEIGYREQVGLLAYSPLAFGHLSGKYLDDPQAPGRISEFPAFGQRYTKENVRPAVAAYGDLASRHGLTPAAMALAFVASREFVASTIIGATTLEQLRDNIAACATVLSPEVLAGIETLHLRYTNPAP